MVFADPAVECRVEDLTGRCEAVLESWRRTPCSSTPSLVDHLQYDGDHPAAEGDHLHARHQRRAMGRAAPVGAAARARAVSATRPCREGARCSRDVWPRHTIPVTMNQRLRVDLSAFVFGPWPFAGAVIYNPTTPRPPPTPQPHDPTTPQPYALHCQHGCGNAARCCRAIGLTAWTSCSPTFPPPFRIDGLDIPEGRSEAEVYDRLHRLSHRNAHDLICFLGGGFYDHFIPAAVDALAVAQRVLHRLHALPAGGVAGHAAGDLRVPDRRSAA